MCGVNCSIDLRPECAHQWTWVWSVDLGVECGSKFRVWTSELSLYLIPECGPRFGEGTSDQSVEGVWKSVYLGVECEPQSGERTLIQSVNLDMGC